MADRYTNSVSPKPPFVQAKRLSEDRVPLLLHRRGTFPYREAQHVPRWLRRTLLTLILFLGAVYVVRGFWDLHDQWTKRRPTDFTDLHASVRDLWPPPRPLRRENENEIDDRYHYVKYLAHGQEGAVAVYIDQDTDKSVVMKTWTIQPRNEIPEQLRPYFAPLTTHWPAEIEAGLLLGSFSSFIRLTDYFILARGDKWGWAMVEPFESGGTLLKLAKEEALSQNHTIAGLDNKYRPIFFDLFQGLKPLHEAEMCHDDVKPDNIFVKSPEHWRLGDLGNVRQASHAFHFTASWKRQNQWANCRINDVRRALKTYLWFLRLASADVVEFDRQFWEKSEPWSRIYWDFADSPTDIDGVLERLRNLPDSTEHLSLASRDVLESSMVSRKSESELAWKTERELICTTIPRRLWPWYWRFAPIW